MINKRCNKHQTKPKDNEKGAGPRATFDFYEGKRSSRPIKSVDRQYRAESKAVRWVNAGESCDLLHESFKRWAAGAISSVLGLLELQACSLQRLQGLRRSNN